MAGKVLVAALIVFAIGCIWELIANWEVALMSLGLFGSGIALLITLDWFKNRRGDRTPV